MTDHRSLERRVFLACGLLLLAGCMPPKPEYDMEKAHAYFVECLEKLPVGPQAAKYNDWDEVVTECRASAFSLARTNR